MRVTLSVKLNLKYETHRAIAEAIQQEDNVSNAIFRALEAYYLHPSDNSIATTVDQSAVLDAIAALRVDLASVKRKLDNVKTTQPQPAHSVSAEQAEQGLLDGGMSQAALVALKTKVFKPVIRLEQ